MQILTKYDIEYKCKRNYHKSTMKMFLWLLTNLFDQVSISHSYFNKNKISDKTVLTNLFNRINHAFTIDYHLLEMKNIKRMFSCNHQ